MQRGSSDCFAFDRFFLTLSAYDHKPPPSELALPVRRCGARRQSHKAR